MDGINNTMLVEKLLTKLLVTKLRQFFKKMYRKVLMQSVL
jgi:hypothetical protein